jgi:multisubunit Na+/H+ antiporter MnhC subunit
VTYVLVLGGAPLLVAALLAGAPYLIAHSIDTWRGRVVLARLGYAGAAFTVAWGVAIAVRFTTLATRPFHDCPETSSVSGAFVLPLPIALIATALVVGLADRARLALTLAILSAGAGFGAMWFVALCGLGG